MDTVWSRWQQTRALPLALGLLAAFALSALAAARSSPGEGHATGLWPAALAAALLLLVRRDHLVAWASLVLLASGAATLSAGRPGVVALGLAISATLGALVTALGLTHDRQRMATPDRFARLPSLLGDRDLYVLFASCSAGATTAAGIGALTSAVAGWGNPFEVLLALLLAHGASYLTLMPLVCRLPEHAAVAGRGERILQWLLIVSTTPVILLVDAGPSLVFLMVPLLVWGAMRIRPTEALGQMIALLFVVVVVTSLDAGPFAEVPSLYGLSVDARGMVLSGFVITCALIVVPVFVRVGESIALAEGAAVERDRLRSIVDNATGVAIIGAEPNGQITLFNPGAERLLGYRAEQVLGRHTSMFHSAEGVAQKAGELGVNPTTLDVALAMIDRGLTGTSMGFVRADGVERTHSMTLSRIADARGRSRGFVSISEDVTDLVDARRAMVESIAAEQRALERLQEAEAVKDALISTVSHELRTPITSIVGYLEMLDDGSYGELAARQSDAVRRVRSNSQRLLGLIDDLLTMARVNDAGVRLVPQDVDLRQAVESAVEVVRSAAGPHHTLGVVLPVEPVLLAGDREMIERVVVNLVGNAIKFTPDGGRVEVRVLVTGERAVLHVQDTGIGIPVDEQAQLFERFFRSRLAQGRAIPGSGLGLAICRAIVERHHGAIEVRSAPGEGTTVEASFPIRNIQLSTTVGVDDPRRWAPCPQQPSTT